MEQEFDLEPYILAIIRRWYWIVALTVAAAAVALVVTFLSPPSYEATALVAIRQSDEIINFDPRILAVEQSQPLRAYPDLALSDDVVQTVLRELSPPLPGVDSPARLRQLLSADLGSDPRLIRLTVSYQAPDEATRVANLWAVVFAAKAIDVFSSPNEEELNFFTDQLDEAARQLVAAEQALLDFEDGSRMHVSSIALDAYSAVFTENVAEQNRISGLRQNVQGLHAQLDKQEAVSVVSFGEQLAALTLQLAVFAEAGDDSLALQITSEGGALESAITVAEQIEALERIEATLQAQHLAMEGTIVVLEGQMKALETERQALSIEHRRLQRALSLAEETYTLLANKVTEERIEVGSADRQIRLASEASVPAQPVLSVQVLPVVLAAAVGGLLGLFYVVARVWWHSFRQQADRKQSGGG